MADFSLNVFLYIGGWDDVCGEGVAKAEVPTGTVAMSSSALMEVAIRVQGMMIVNTMKGRAKYRDEMTTNAQSHGLRWFAMVLSLLTHNCRLISCSESLNLFRFCFVQGNASLNLVCECSTYLGWVHIKENSVCLISPHAKQIWFHDKQFTVSQQLSPKKKMLQTYVSWKEESILRWISKIDPGLMMNSWSLLQIHHGQGNNLQRLRLFPCSKINQTYFFNFICLHA